MRNLKLLKNIFNVYLHQPKTINHVPIQCFCLNRAIKTPVLPSLDYSVRYYAKTKDKKKDKKTKTNVVDENMLAEVINLEKFYKEQDMNINNLKEEFVKYLTIRTSMGALDTIKVEFEEKEYELQELAQIGRKNTKTIVLNLSAFPQVIPNVIKAIQESGMGLNPQQDGTMLYIPVPKVTKEHREKLVKNAKAIFIKSRDSIKETQNQFIKKAKNKDKISEDVFFSAKEQITSLGDKYVSKAESIFKDKQAELLQEDK